MSKPKRFESNAAYKKWWAEQNKQHCQDYKKAYYLENKERSLQNRRELKETNKRMALETLGGKCVDCGCKDNLEFDHIIPQGSTKVSQLYGSTNQLKEELKKCVLRCKTCHKERTKQQHTLAWHILKCLPAETLEQWLEHPPTEASLQTLFQTTQQTLT